MSVFTAIVVVLAGLVLVARRLLVPSGEVAITVNERRVLDVPAGDKLLWTLASQGLQLPAACGGRGSCGQCRVVVEHGGGPPLQTELAQIGRRDLRRHVRLACMVTVRNDLTIRVPEEILEAREWHCSVRSNRRVSTFLTELALELPPGADFGFEAGQYVLLHAPPGRTAFADFDIGDDYRSEWERNGLFDLVAERDSAAVRAYSLASHPREDVVKLIIRIAIPPPSAPSGTMPGRVSSYAFALKPGDEAEISGPFGDFRVQETDREMLFIGGGAGIAPLRSMILDQLLNRQAQRRIRFFYGARSLDDLCHRREFDELAARYDNFDWTVALSAPQPGDDWSGPTGFIHSVVSEQYLESHPRPEEVEYYICGPPVMASAVLAMLEDLGVDRESVFLDDFGG